MCNQTLLIQVGKLIIQNSLAIFDTKKRLLSITLNKMLLSLQKFIENIYQRIDRSKKSKIKRQIQINNLKQVLDQLTGLQFMSPKIFAKNLIHLLAILEQNLDQGDPGMMISFYEIIVNNLDHIQFCYGSNNPKKNKQKQIVKLVSLLCRQISKILSIPKQNYVANQNIKFLKLYQSQQQKLQILQQKDPQSALLLNYINLISRIVEAISLQNIYQSLLTILGQLASLRTQSIQISILITVVQLVQVGQLSKFINFIQFIYNNLSHSNIYVRYYSNYCLKVIAEKRRKEFQTHYYDLFIPVVVRGLNQTNQQILICWLQSLSSLNQGVQNKYQILPYVQNVVNRVCFLLQNSCHHKLLQNCLNCLVILSCIRKLVNQNCLKRFLQICYSFLCKQKSINEVNKKNPNKTQQEQNQNTNLIVNTIQCMSSILYGVGYYSAKDIISFVVNIVCQNIEYLCLENYQISFYVTWQNLCGVGVRFDKWKIVFQKVFQVILTYEATNHQQDKIEIYKTIKSTLECFQQQINQCSLQLIQITIKWLKIQIDRKNIQASETILQLIDCILIKSSLSVAGEKLKQPFSTSKSQIISSNETNPNLNSTVIPSSIIKQLLGYYIGLIKSPFTSFDSNQIQQFIDRKQCSQFELKESILISLKTLIENYGSVLNKQEFNYFLTEFWGIVEYFSNRKKTIQKQDIQKCSDDEYQSDISASDQEMQIHDSKGANQQQNTNSNKQIQQQNNLTLIDKCKFCMPDILKQVLKKIEDPSLIIQRILQECQKQISEHKDIYDIACGTLYICVLIQALTYEKISRYWQDFISHLENYSSTKNILLKQFISYSIGIMAQKTPYESINKTTMDKFIQILHRCYQVDEQGKKDQNYKYCFDNCISAVGKIIQKFGRVFNLKYLYNQWLCNLPLKNDEQENKAQIQLLCKIIVGQPYILFDSVDGTTQITNPQSTVAIMIHVIRIFCQLKINIQEQALYQFSSYRELMRRVKAALSQFIQWPIFKQNQIKAHENLSKLQIQQVNDLLQIDY